MYFKLTILAFLATLLLKSVVCAPGQVSFVVASTEAPKTTKVEEDTKNDIPIIYEMNISSNVSNRFATTLIHSKVKNADSSAKEATFSVVLPEKAFISKFVMEIGEKSYEAYVKGKEEAKDIYDKAVSSGQSAAHVSVSARHSNRFTVSINIEASAKAAFLLTYEELLERKNNQYELVLNIHPGQIVKDLNVQVNINETRSLVFVKTPSLRSGNEISKNDEKTPSLSTIEMKEKSAVVKFHPNADQQKEFAKHLGQKESEGLAGQFIVQYEVERDPNGGEVLLQDGYFVHFFAPKDVEPLPKNVYFILDTSGSMYGLKMKNLKEAMTSILGEIKPEDTLSIIEFNSDTLVYNIEAETSVTVEFSNYEEPFGELSAKDMPGPVPATKEIIEKAKKLISQMKDTGSTNMIGGLEAGLYLVKREIEKTSSADNKRQPIIIFLTDGQPNVGIHNTDKITEVVTHLNKDRINVPVFSLSFGEGADKAFLRKLSLKNLGFSRHIYDAADASLQLQDFYKQISSPLLADVNFKYVSEVKEVTKKQYPIFFEGSEIIVAGRYEDPKFDAKVDALGRKGRVILLPKIETPVTSLERLWAYLTVKEILEKRETADNKTELTKKALDLALKYSFVTDVSSLVVVKPNATNSVNTEDASKAHQRPAWHSGGGGNGGVAYSGYPVYLRTGGGGGGGLLSARSSAHSRFHSNLISSTYYPKSKPVPAPLYPVPSSTQPPKLENILPWLPAILNSNRTITLPEGVYELGEWSLHIQTGSTCPKTPKGEEGKCELIKDCPQVFSLLTDFDTYKQFFCPVENKYAGVCCPKTNKN